MTLLNFTLPSVSGGYNVILQDVTFVVKTYIDIKFYAHM